MNGKKILVVDDNIALLNTCTEILEREGYSVITAQSVKEAKQKYTQLGADIGLVVSDYHLSGSELGTDIASWMHQQNGCSCPFILMSGDSENGKFSRIIEDQELQGFWDKGNKNDLLTLVGRYMTPVSAERSGVGYTV